MPGESLPEAYVGFGGVLGDRLYAVHHAGAPKAFPFLTARSRKEMLRFRPRFRRPELTLAPDNLTDAETRGPGLTPLFPSSEDLALEILTSYTPEDFEQADFTSLGEAAVYLTQHSSGPGPALLDLIAKIQKAAGT